MRKEKIAISIVIIVLAVIITGVVFYFYQSSKKIEPNDIKKINVDESTPTPASGLFLTIDSPLDELVTDEKTIKISGKTVPDAKVLVITATNEEAAIPADDGSFSTDIALDPDENIIEIISIAENGESVKVRRVVSYSTEDF